MQTYRTKGKMDRRALLHFLESTGMLSAKKVSEQVLTNLTKVQSRYLRTDRIGRVSARS